VGSWVFDESYPFYQSSSCDIIDPEFNCQMNGRPDSDYLKYRWKPLNCELPRYKKIIKESLAPTCLIKDVSGVLHV